MAVVKGAGPAPGPAHWQRQKGPATPSALRTYQGAPQPFPPPWGKEALKTRIPLLPNQRACHLEARLGLSGQTLDH